MKKVFKVISIIVIIIVVLVGIVFGYSMIKKSIMNNERRNAKTLMEYVKTHDWEYMNCGSSDSNCQYMEFEDNKFICDINSNDIKAFYNNYIITKDNEMYDVSFDKLYSNNQNCKKREIDIDINNIQGSYIFSKDNKIYDITSLEEQQISDYSQIYLLDKDIIKIIDYDYDYTNNKLSVIVFKNNNLYKKIYNFSYIEFGYNKLTFEKEELYKSLEEYGNIKHIFFDSYLYTNNKSYQLEDNTITAIISDKGYYYLDEVKTDECTKYEDVKCELELKESEIYKKFNKDIKYILGEYTILNDNSVIRTNYLTYSLDKDLK